MSLAQFNTSAVKVVDDPPPVARPLLYVATPSVFGSVGDAYHDAMMRLASSATAFDLFLGAPRYGRDLVRTRSWQVSDFLETSATHLAFIDADIDADFGTLFTAMLAADMETRLAGDWGVAYVAAPYTKKRMGPPVYPFVFLPGVPEVRAKHRLVEIAGGGLGCTLLRRDMLEQMTARYAPELTFADTRKGPGTRSTSVALFQLVLEGDVLHAEDTSLGVRWRAMGGRCWLHIPPGEVCGHSGTARFTGRASDFDSVTKGFGT